MQLHNLNPKRVRDPTRMLSAGAAETVKRVLRHIITALHRNLLNRVRHVLNRDPQKPLGDRLGRHLLAGLVGDAARERLKTLAGRARVQRLVAVFAEGARKLVALNASEGGVAVGDGERSAAAVTARTGIRPRRLGTHPETRPVKRQQRPAARRDRLNPQHRRAQPHARDPRLKTALKLAVPVRDIG